MVSGQLLAAAIRAELAARRTTPNAFTEGRPGLIGSHLTRWDDGMTPQLYILERWAEALDRPVIDLLKWAGYDKVQAEPVEPIKSARERLEAALLDTPLRKDEKSRLMILGLYDMLVNGVTPGALPPSK